MTRPRAARMPPDLASFIRLLRLAAPFRWWMLLSVLLGCVTIASNIGLMSTAAWLIASAALHPPVGTLHVAIAGVRFFGIARGVFRYLERYASHQTTFRLLAQLRVWFYAHVEPLAPARLAVYHSGDLLARGVDDINTLENFYLRVIAPPAIALLTAAGLFGFMAMYDLRLALALSVFLALVGMGVPWLTQRLGRHTGREMIRTRARLSVRLVDGVQGLSDLIAYGAQQRHFEHVQVLNRTLQQQQTHLARITGLHTALTSLLISLATITTLVLAIPLVRAGQLDGVLLAVLTLVTLSGFEALLPLPAAFQQLSGNLQAAQRLFDLVDADPAVHDPVDPVFVSPSEPQPDPFLCMSQVCFRYETGASLALDEVSLALPSGGTVAIVGASGAGKSSLLNVLLRFWEYESGHITLAGHDLRDLAQEDARALMSVVSQTTYLFNATIRENLLVARPDASEDELVHAVQAAQLHSFIGSLPQGYDTWIGEQGLGLSGGERQRLAIARAILKDAPLLILDEATANLDTVTERAILNTIHTALAQRTTLMITHRLVGMDAVDQILMLHNGRIIEQGRHRDLLQTESYYRRMWHVQHQVLA